MSTLSIIISSTSDNGATRLVLLSLVLVAVVLLLAGSTIAILTFINQRKASQASIPSNQLQGENT
jgi:flagellar basal body-associated protein FliL